MGFNNNISPVDKEIDSIVKDIKSLLTETGKKIEEIHTEVVSGNSTPKQFVFTSSPVNIKDLLPDIYDQLTTADFWVGMHGITVHTNQHTGYDHYDGLYFTYTTSLAYNAAQGILTFSEPASTAGPNPYVGGVITDRTINGGTFAVYLGTIAGKAVS